MGPAVSRVVDGVGNPLELVMAPPYPQRVRVYLYNATNPPGGRPTPEHKIQLIVPGQGRNERGDFDRTDGAEVLLVGKVEDLEAWVLWDADMHSDFAYSKNAQVRSETVAMALDEHAIVPQARVLQRGGEEFVLATPTALLPQAVLTRLS